MTLKNLLEITESFPGWEICYVQQYNRSAFMRLLYRGSDMKSIPALEESTLDDSFPCVFEDFSAPSYVDYRIDIPETWEKHFKHLPIYSSN